ncbi:hypothetical protein PJF56_11805 [Roseofilum sp. BLCC_M91]|uniref:PIN domain-containing protein n=1 Tax=Roseofilum halophilum BLCC-M91 TaxID=3022259 RepID=A0ABT7BK37_9CYAN|nr:hypothetical protein [Roseofilum halophilum]MDJ1179549.1 hypothetical protein [Roseofilum halophilum BLCC-M91]
MTQFVLDTVVLRVFAFSHPQGIDILLEALNTPQAIFPSEVFNADENNLPLTESDQNLSELARGLRYARRQVQSQPELTRKRFQIRLENANQLYHHLQTGSLLITPLELQEIPRREQLMTTHGIGRGESACLTLAERNTSIAIFLSSDEAACQVAQILGIAHLTIPDILRQWILEVNPTLEQFQDLIEGMKNAAFTLPKPIDQELNQLFEL